MLCANDNPDSLSEKEFDSLGQDGAFVLTNSPATRRRARRVLPQGPGDARTGRVAVSGQARNQ
jgi:hypothetical protein